MPQIATYMEVAVSAVEAVRLNNSNRTSSEEEIAAGSQRELSLFRAEGTRVRNCPLDIRT